MKAVTGQMDRLPNAGITTVLVSVIFCIVLDHLIEIVAPKSQKKKTSDLQRLRDGFISDNMYKCLRNTNHLFACLKKIWYRFEPQARLV